jgi:UDP-N-acetylglucosamine 4,6-dehydratase
MGRILTKELKMILVTGATGFLGRELLNRLQGDRRALSIRVLSRNEGKLVELKQRYPEIEIMSGCVSDPTICGQALQGIDIVYHLAAFKHVGLAEKQPYQCVNSNLIGTINLLRQFTGSSFMAISTDKATQVNGVYGATKYLMERVISEFEQSNPDTQYRVVRYGNVLYSTGSVLCKWKEALLAGDKVVVTDLNATRFFWSVPQAIDLIFDCEKLATDSTPYCPDMKAMSMGNLLEAMRQKYGRDSRVEVIGLQPGENLHETLHKDGPFSNEVEQFTVAEIKELI